MMIINILTNILKRNKVILLKSIKRIKKVREPIIEPNIILFNLIFLLRRIETDKSNNKSNHILSKNIKSMYSVILSPHIV